MLGYFIDWEQQVKPTELQTGESPLPSMRLVHREGAQSIAARIDEGSSSPSGSLCKAPDVDLIGGGLGFVWRFAIGVVAGLATAAIGEILVAYPLTGQLEPWAVLSVASGLLLGPAGVVGSAIAHFVISLPETSSPIRVLIQTGAYILVGVLAYSIFRLVPKLDRGLTDLRSLLGFLAAAAAGSLALAGIGSATLFWGTARSSAYWTGVVYWFSSAFTSLLIVTPFLLVVATWKLRRWLVTMPGGSPHSGVPGLRSGVSQREASRMIRRDIVVGTAMVLGLTAVVSPLVHVNPHYGGWLALLYLVPILWGSISRGLRGGVLVASGSAVAFLVGSAVSSSFLPRAVNHDEVLGQFVGLVILSVVGAITGVFQQARLLAEAALLQSKLEVESRHESLALVHGLADRLKRTLDIETIAREAVEALNQLSQPPLVAVHILDESGTTMDLKAHHGFDEAVLAASQNLPVEGSLSGAALSLREILVCNDIATDSRLEPQTRSQMVQAGLQSAVSIPLVFEREALGVINLIYRDRSTAARQDRQVLATIGRTVALAIVNARHVARLEHLAFHDRLTGLPNREALHRWFAECAHSGQNGYQTLGLVFLDIDRFNEVNDALGHSVGDQLLAQIGPRIDAALIDRGPLVYSLAGDQFAVILRDLKEKPAYEAVTGELVTALAAPFEVSGMAVQIEASAGIALFPIDGLTSSELLRCADVAVNHAKRTSNRIVCYHRSLDQHTPERLALAADLGRAIRDDQLVLHFQPKVMLAGGHAVGFEALVRWKHPTLGLLPPDRFIPLAEVGDLIHPLTYWVVEHALEQLREWQRFESRLTMAVNLSTRNLLDRSCAETLDGLVKRAQIDPGTVEFELTETALLIDPEAAAATLLEITRNGARVVIDDFGTGYSSMAFLKRCPIHALKIDRSFVGDMRSDVQSRAIVRATLQLADDLGLAVVAEGIENAGTVDALSDLGCDMGQGFYFQRPAPANLLEQHIAGWGAKRA